MAGAVRVKFKKSQDEILDSNLGSLFLEVPNDCLTRPQRELLAGLLLERIKTFDGNDDVAPSQWALVLIVLTKLMKRPTFCEVCHIPLQALYNIS